MRDTIAFLTTEDQANRQEVGTVALTDGQIVGVTYHVAVQKTARGWFLADGWEFPVKPHEILPLTVIHEPMKVEGY